MLKVSNFHFKNFIFESGIDKLVKRWIEQQQLVADWWGQLVAKENISFLFCDLCFKKAEAHVELKCVRCNEYSSIFVPSFYQFSPQPMIPLYILYSVYTSSSSQSDWHLFWCFSVCFFFFPPLLKLEKNAAHWQLNISYNIVEWEVWTNISFRLKFH